jgi:chromosome segregation ATPase
LTQKNKIAELVDDNKKLINLCQEQEHNLSIMDDDILNLDQKLKEDNANINNLNCKIRLYTSNLNDLRNKLDQSNVLNMKLKKDLQSLSNVYKQFELDKQTMINELNKEYSIRKDEENNQNKLCTLLNDRQSKLQNLSQDYLCMKNMNEKVHLVKNMYQRENDKLEDHILMLTRQNENLSGEIDQVIKDDNQMKNILNRSDRMSTMLKSNDDVMYQMPQSSYNTPDCYRYNNSHLSPSRSYNRMNLSKNLERQRCMSPKYTYSRVNNNF